MTSLVERVARALAETDGYEPTVKGIEALIPHARAAIAAMREPTDAMINATYEGSDPAELWRMMIDAALAELSNSSRVGAAEEHGHGGSQS